MSPASLCARLAMLALAVAATSGDCPERCRCRSAAYSCGARDGLAWLSSLSELRPESLALDPPPESVDAFSSASSLDSLRDLTVGDGGYATLPSLRAFPSLKRLALTGNNVSVIEELALPPGLRRLDLSDNNVSRLHPDAFARARELDTLHLSSNRIADLEPTPFARLSSLVELRIDSNRVRRLPAAAFADLGALELLDARRNFVADVHQYAFRNLTNLRELKLQRNRIRRLPDGAFYALAELRALRLDSNRIEFVSRGWTFGLTSLDSLTLSRNRVELVERDCWEWSRGRLRSLDLSLNRLDKVDALAFDGLEALRHLNLSANRIARLDDGAFATLVRLETLDLSRNSLARQLEDGRRPFAGLRSLRTLSLARNGIESIGEGALRGLTALDELDLSGNELASLRESAFEPSRRPAALRVDSSSLLCDCGVAWLASAGGADATCAYPPRLDGKTLGELSAGELTCAESPEPVVVEHPSSTVAVRGGELTLRCATARSTRLRWTHNGTDASFAGGADASTLHVRNVSDSDAGEYRCVASNAYGSAYSRRAQVSVLVLPRFDKTPRDVSVRAGETAKLVCAASGRPPPEISWRKRDGDFTAARERRMHVMPADDAFFIIDAKPADAGVYSCDATNPAGTVAADAALVVLEPPSLVASPDAKEVPAGESVVVECMASGSPKPTLVWLKDGEPIAVTERHFFTAEDQLLIVVNAAPSDSGLYECDVSNELGRVRGSSEVRVLPPTLASHPADEDTTGVIVITVVCCAVATSVVWVVIIYQTRKRLRRAAERQARSPPPDSVHLTQLTRRPDGDDASDDGSSCRDSGTGDSKRSDVEVYVNPTHTVQMHRTDVHRPEGTFPYS